MLFIFVVFFFLSVYLKIRLDELHLFLFGNQRTCWSLEVPQVDTCSYSGCFYIQEDEITKKGKVN